MSKSYLGDLPESIRTAVISGLDREIEQHTRKLNALKNAGTFDRRDADFLEGDIAQVRALKERLLTGSSAV